MSVTLTTYGVANGVLTVDATVTVPVEGWLFSFYYITCPASQDYADQVPPKEYITVDANGVVNGNAQMHLTTGRRISKIPLSMWPNGELTFTLRAMYYSATPAPHYEYEAGPSITITNTYSQASLAAPDTTYPEGEITKPVTITFDAPASSETAEVSVTLAAVDNVAVTGYLITESSTAPLSSDSRWGATAPTSYTVSAPGTRTLYAWAKDSDGNVSDPVTATVTATFTVTAVDADATGSEYTAQTGAAAASGSGAVATTGTEQAATAGTATSTGSSNVAALGIDTSLEIGQATATGGDLAPGFYLRSAAGIYYALADSQGRQYALSN